MRTPIRTGAVGPTLPVKQTPSAAGARSGVGRLQNAAKNSKAIKRRGTDFRSRV